MFSQRFIASVKCNALRFTAAVICRTLLLRARVFASPFSVVTPKNYILCDAHLSRRAQWWNHLFGIARASRRIYTVLMIILNESFKRLDRFLFRYAAPKQEQPANKVVARKQILKSHHLYLIFNAKRECLIRRRF